MLTNQEIFDKVAAHLLTQNRQALRHNTETSEDGPLCRYRVVAPDGAVLKCAAGCLIADELYDPALETAGGIPAIFGGMGSPIRQRARDIFAMSGMDGSEGAVELLAALQVLHDNHMPHEWDTKLRSLASLRNLRVNW